MRNLVIAGLFLFTAPSLASLIYTPTNFNKETAQIVVVIHGCLQSAESMSLGTGWDQIAEKNNLIVLYPQVPTQSNPLDCWGWYLSENQRPDSGQVKLIMDEVKNLKTTYDLKNASVFVTGISSGAGLAANLLACHPDEFQGGALHSGMSYGVAQDLAAAQKVMSQGPSESPSSAPCKPQNFNGTILVIQGTSDKIVHPLNASRIIHDFTGEKNPSSKDELKGGGLSYTVSNYSTSGNPRGRLVMIQNLDHAWSGFSENLRNKVLLAPKAQFPTILPFFSDQGPSATNLSWEFFKSSKRNPSGMKKK